MCFDKKILRKEREKIKSLRSTPIVLVACQGARIMSIHSSFVG